MRKREIITKLQAENVATLEYVFNLEERFKNLALLASNVEARVDGLEEQMGQLMSILQDKQ